MPNSENSGQITLGELWNKHEINNGFSEIMMSYIAKIYKRRENQAHLEEEKDKNVANVRVHSSFYRELIKQYNSNNIVN